MGTIENSKDPDEMPHNAVFHQGLQRQNQSSEKKVHFSEIITCDPSIYMIYHPVSNFMEYSIGP